MVIRNMLRTHEGKHDFSEMNFKFATALDRNNCLNQIKLPNSLHMCAHISELPSHISGIAGTLSKK